MKPVPRSSFTFAILSVAVWIAAMGHPFAAAGQAVDRIGSDSGAVAFAGRSGPVISTPIRQRAVLIALGGASAHAPEHTLEAYELAIEQGADFIEPDVQVSRDGHLVVIHDETLDRTTDVAELYPFRFREDRTPDGEVVRRWYVRDFTLSELKRLDAGSWFSTRFAGASIPTFEEVLELARGRVGVFPETKSPEVYHKLGHKVEHLLVEALARHGLAEPGADPDTPIMVQSLSAESLRRLREEVGSELPSAFLLTGRDATYWLSHEGLTEISTFATGIAPTKRLLAHQPDVVGRAHDHELVVLPWTFTAANSGSFQTVLEEMAHYLCDLGVDGVFTDTPDVFASAALCLAAN